MDKQILLTGTKGNYYGITFLRLPDETQQKIKEIDQQLQSLGFQLLGCLTFSHFQDISTNIYVSEDKTICASVVRVKKDFASLEFVSYFADEAYLTTTTTKLKVNAYEQQKLFRCSHPNLDGVALYERHLKYRADFKQGHGDTQPIFSDLRSVAVMIDNYLQRQDSNPMHRMMTLVNGLEIVSQSTDATELEDELEEDEDEFEDDDEPINYQPEDAENPLVAAIIQGDVATVETLINDGLGLDKYDRKLYYSPLGMAIELGNVEIVRLLLEAGANPNAGEIGYTSLGIAVKNGNLEIAQLLIDAGVDVNSAIGEDDYKALMKAALEGYLEIVKFLVAEGADVNRWSQGQNALMDAAANGHRDVYEFLYPLVDNYTRQRADKWGEKDIQAALIRREREQNKLAENFIDAAMYGKLKKVKAAIANGVDLNAIGSSGCTALMYAANYGHLPVIKALLEAGADPNILSDNDEGLGEGKTALMIVASSCFAPNPIEIIKLLVASGADVNIQGKNGKTALMCAANVNHVQCVKTLIELGADINARDEQGNTTLMLMGLTRLRGAMISCLKRAGASEEGMTEVALINAANEGDIEQVRTILKTNVNVNHNEGEALQKAAREGHLEIVKLLIKADADVNLGAKSGFTPLAEATYRGDLEIVELLINAGADIHTRSHDGEGYNPLEYAYLGEWEGHHQGGQHAAIIKILEEVGGITEAF